MERARLVGAISILLLTMGCSGSGSTSPTPNSSVAASGVGSAPSSSPASPAASASASSGTVSTPGAAVDAYLASNPSALGDVASVVVMVDGAVAVSKNVNGTSGEPRDIQSLGAMVVDLLVGMARDDGRFTNLDTTLPVLLPEYASRMSAQARAITLRQLLLMTAGLPDGSRFYAAVWGKNADWVATLSHGDLLQPPGSGFALTQDATADLLVAALQRAVGRSVVDFARARLFTPLGITTTPAFEGPLDARDPSGYEKAGFAWPTDPRGHHLGVAMKLTARDLATIGQLWLDNGRWQGRQLVSSAWAADMGKPLQSVGTESDGAPIGYGYGLFSAKITGHVAYAAVGLGSLMEVIPDLRLVVAVTSKTPVDPTGPMDAGAIADGSEFDALVSAIEPTIH